MRNIVIVLVMVMIAACSTGGNGSPSAATVVVPTFKPIPSGECPTAQMAAVRLRGDRAADPPVWVEDAQGKKMSVLWPNGFSARFDPDLSLIGADGRVIARSGDLLDLGGGQVDPSYDFFACEVTDRTVSP
jgi:hypothetical protein